MTRLGDRGRWGVGLALFAGLCGYLIAFQGGFSDWLTFTILGSPPIRYAFVQAE